jgi:hypothetical protein
MPSLGLALLIVTAISAAAPAGAAAQSGAPNLPFVEIDAPEGIVDDPKRPGTMRVYDSERREHYNGPIGIELRGYTSQQDDPKKSYAVETQTDLGENRNVSLLGMPADDDWVLIAGYRDESLLRNFVAYSTARKMGRYAARARLVEVFLNDSYEGVYLLAEDLKIHKDRVAVDGSDISGGYLVEMTSTRRTAGERFFTTPVTNRPFFYKDPKPHEIPNDRAAWISGYISQFERTLYGQQFTDPQVGYRAELDVSAAVDYLLLNELFRNADTFRNSTYMHKSAGGTLVLGPLWDFDHAIGNDGDAEDNLTTGWEYTASPWAERFYADPYFRSRMALHWDAMQKQGLTSHIMQTIDAGSALLAEAAARNEERWPVFSANRAFPPDPRTGQRPANYAQAVDYLKWWLTQRIQWMDANLVVPREPSPEPTPQERARLIVRATRKKLEPRRRVTFRLRLSDGDPRRVVIRTGGRKVKTFDRVTSTRTRRYRWRAPRLRVATEQTFSFKAKGLPKVKRTIKLTREKNDDELQAGMQG